MSAKEMRDELKALRKEHSDYRPVSKMKKGDISELIQRLRAGREETPNVASITNAPARKVKPEATTVRKAKEMEFPLEFADEPVAKPKKKMTAKMPEPKMKASAPPAKGGRPAKGSEEMKARMSAIRAKKGKKDE
jgi:hypothetical protein